MDAWSGGQRHAGCSRRCQLDGSNIITAKVRTNTRASSKKKKNLHARAAGAAEWPQICWQGFPPVTGDSAKEDDDVLTGQRCRYRPITEGSFTLGAPGQLMFIAGSLFKACRAQKCCAQHFAVIFDQLKTCADAKMHPIYFPQLDILIKRD